MHEEHLILLWGKHCTGVCQILRARESLLQRWKGGLAQYQEHAIWTKGAGAHTIGNCQRLGQQLQHYAAGAAATMAKIFHKHFIHPEPVRRYWDDLSETKNTAPTGGWDTIERGARKCNWKSKNWKAGGNSNILPKMVKVACCEDNFLELLLDLAHCVAREQGSPKTRQTWYPYPF